MRGPEEAGTRRHKAGRGLAQVHKPWDTVFLFSPLFAGYLWPELASWEIPRFTFPLAPYSVARVASG